MLVELQDSWHYKASLKLTFLHYIIFEGFNYPIFHHLTRLRIGFSVRLHWNHPNIIRMGPMQLNTEANPSSFNCMFQLSVDPCQMSNQCDFDTDSIQRLEFLKRKLQFFEYNTDRKLPIPVT